MPQGSDKSLAKNRYEIRHLLCILHSSNKSWQILKKMTNKNLNIVKKLVYLSDIYSCGLSTATIEYSCPSACVSFRPSVCVCVHDNSKNNDSIDLKLENIVVYENSLDEFDIGHCPIKVKVTV